LNTETEKPDKFEDMDINLDDDLICNIIDRQAKADLSSASYSFVETALRNRKKDKQPIETLFEAFGRAVFNEIVVRLVMAESEAKVESEAKEHKIENKDSKETNE